MLFKLDDGAFMPERAYPSDAGIDLKAMETKVVPAHGSATFNTGVHVQLPAGTAGLLVSKSGLNVKHGLTSTGLIDENFSGAITVKLYNDADEDYTVVAGDRISQLVVLEIWHDPLIQIVDDIPVVGRGNNGIGSTGR